MVTDVVTYSSRINVSVYLVENERNRQSRSVLSEVGEVKNLIRNQTILRSS
jgi:hypothetical protein